MINSTQILVLVPGLLSDDAVWRPVIDHFSEQMNVGVAACQTQNSLTEMARDTLGAYDGPLAVAGHSMGGRVALEMVRLAPERIARLALLDTGVHPRKDGEEDKRQVLVDSAFSEGMRALADRWLPPMVHPDRHDDEQLMALLTAMVERMTPQIHQQQITALLNRPDAAPGLDQIDCPVTLIVGRQDEWSPVSQHEAMLPHLKNAQLEVIEDAGHFAPIEQPAAIISAFEKWLKQA